MTSGMLWFDNRQVSLAEKISKAAAYYQKKYGRAPELCLVNPVVLTGATLDDVNGIAVRPWRSVLPGHLWIGVEDETELAKEEVIA